MGKKTIELTDEEIQATEECILHAMKTLGLDKEPILNRVLDILGWGNAVVDQYKRWTPDENM